MAAAKDCRILTQYYMQLWKDKYKSGAVVNAHKARWGFDNVLMTMTLGEAKRLLEFYMDTESNNQHSLEWFFYNYEKIEAAIEQSAADAQHRRVLREQTKARVEKWSKRIGIDGVKNTQLDSTN